MTTIRTVLVGAHGFERAAVWSAVGFALSYLSFDAAALAGWPTAEWVAAGCALVAGVGAVGFARGGGGALPATLLVYGPLAGVILRTVEPVLLPVPAAEPFVAALAAALAIGPAGYLVGRLIAPAEPDASESATPAEGATETTAADASGSEATD